MGNSVALHFHLIKCRLSPLGTYHQHFKDYFQQYRRCRIDKYTPAKTRGPNCLPYIFAIATLWKNSDSSELPNQLRGDFIRLCKKMKCNFEGGFAASKEHPDYHGYKDLILETPYPVEEYIRKTKLSAFVFNTPAVHHCHGWKLGEYLAMGKAIISTPLLNRLPAPLVHGTQIHIVSDHQELKLAVATLLTDDEQKATLEKNAYEYYLKYASPASVIRHILGISR